MSRIGKMPIDVPKGVEVKMNDGQITVKGPKGTLSRKLVAQIKVEIKDNRIVVLRSSEENKVKAMHGLYRTLINNMVEGVSKGFEKRLVLSGVGYRGQIQGKKLILQIGYSKPSEFDPPEGITIKVEGSQVVVSGADKEMVGQVAANIRAEKPVEPYKAKGIRYDYEQVRKKAGKAAKAAAGAGGAAK